MRLFGRKYKLTVDTTEFTDLDIAFNARKSLKNEPNTCEMSALNLHRGQRGGLEALRPKKEDPLGIPVKLEAGYDEATSLVWLGDIRTVETEWSDQDSVTLLGSGDGEKTTKESDIYQSFGPGTPVDVILKALVKSLGIGDGNIALAIATLGANRIAREIAAQGLTLAGSSSRLLKSLTDSLELEWSIQGGVLQFLERGKPLPGRIVQLSEKTGLVGEPAIDNEGLLNATMLMIEDVVPGIILSVDTPDIKGLFRMLEGEWEGVTDGDPWYIHAIGERVG